MTNQELINYWINSSDDNYNSMLNIYNTGEYMWSLFIGHLVIEKLLKAYYVKNVDNEIPRTHDLFKIAMLANMDLSEERKDVLQNITLFNIESRYEEHKRDFYRKCTKEFAEKNIEIIKELRTWLKGKIKA
ncbi:MAG: HEPN domain-containing protein [bacterium]